MARLYINKCITKERDKMQNWWFTGEDGISYQDVNDFISRIPTGDDRIDIELYSCGGDCTEGFAIYDALRTCGKQLFTQVVGECASMATIIALAAPAENRSAFKHARFLIHEPYYPDGIYGAIDIQKLETLKSSLDTDRQKLKDIYVERTSQTEKVIEEQMNLGTWFSADEALELGFISSITMETAAVVEEPKKSTTIQNLETMNKEKTSKNAIAKAFDNLATVLGFKGMERIVDLELTATDGTVITIERDEGDIQIGDAASPDGTFSLEDGRVITIQDGVITDIKEGEEPEETQEPEEDLSAKIDALTTQIAELRQLLSNAEANAKTSDEVQILTAVNNLGGIEALKNMEIGRAKLPEKAPRQDVKRENPFSIEARQAFKKKMGRK